jgi:hypothetical protein
MKNETLLETLDTVNGCTFVGIDTETTVKLTGGKKNEMQGRVTKRTTGIKAFAFGNGGTNGYENMVNRRLAAEGKDANFQVGALAWGQRLPDSPIIEHNGGFYLQLVIDERAHPSVEYLLDGKPVAKDSIVGLPVSKPATNQGLENDVKVRTFKAESIVRIRAWGEEIA